MARFVWLRGRSDYAIVHALQRALVDARHHQQVPDTVLLLEHAPVITVGRARGAEANVVDAGDTPVVRVERGGDVTWHGPGQLVAYPIVALRGARADLHRHLHSLEDAVIGLLRDLGLDPGRDPRNTGVWLDDRAGQRRKVCSVGIACRRWVSWHGLALNVAPDLRDGFGRINPCGFDTSVMTSLDEHMEAPLAVPALARPLAEHLASALEVPLESWSVSTAEALFPPAPSDHQA
ncbi:MAG: lipoyl(octanoyl) transferase [Myxococcota bacterium]|jgi:lipoyl(octanoyl) transferase